MAVKTQFTYQGEAYPNAYLRIKKIILGVGDIGELKDRPDGNLYEEMVKEYESHAFVFVYVDKEARDAGVPAITQFGIEFNYNQKNNAWVDAYEALKNTEFVSTNLNGYENV